MSEIPEEAVRAGHSAIAAQWAGGIAPLPITRGDFRIGLAAALPHLRVQETPVCTCPPAQIWGSGGDLIDQDSDPECQIHSAPVCWCGGAVGAREPGDALWLGCLANITHNWTDTPHPRPVVDREVLRRDVIRTLGEELTAEGVVGYHLPQKLATAVLALLPTEEGEGS